MTHCVLNKYLAKFLIFFAGYLLSRNKVIEIKLCYANNSIINMKGSNCEVIGKCVSYD